MKKYGLLGHKLSHSISPLVHGIILDYIDLKGEYHIFERETNEIKSLLNEINKCEIDGINVTIPYKQTVFDLVDEVNTEAGEIGAINTICLKNDRLIGYNTDYFGFIKMLECNDIAVKGKNVVVLGNGGSSKAVCYALGQLSAKKITIVSRNPDKNHIKHDIISYIDLENTDYDVIVNTTPVGMYPNVDNCPIGEVLIKKADAVVDIIYRPSMTKLLTIADNNGIKNVNGLYMLVAQAIRAQEIWNDIEFSNEDIFKIHELVVGGYDFG